MGRSRDPYQIPKAGVEIAPLAGLASVNINRSVGPVSSTEFVGESTLGGVLVYAIYQALLTGLRTEAMRKRGALDRQTQIRLVAESVWASAKESAAPTSSRHAERPACCHQRGRRVPRRATASGP